VIYNAKTKQFVMWMHYEKRSDYSLARAAVAVSADIEKPFTYQRSFRPFNNMSRDCTLFLDDDGSAYFFSSARENYDMMMYRLTDDFLDVKEQVATLWPGGHREAPAIVKRKGYYFMITSGCTGWAPNQAKYAVAKSIRGPWSELTDIGDATTYHSQPTYILPINGKKESSYLYVGDRWDGKHYFNSKYIFLPLVFENDITMRLPWKDSCNVNIATGSVK
jgi:beta-xylosidase